MKKIICIALLMLPTMAPAADLDFADAYSTLKNDPDQLAEFKDFVKTGFKELTQQIAPTLPQKIDSTTTINSIMSLDNLMAVTYSLDLSEFDEALIKDPQIWKEFKKGVADQVAAYWCSNPAIRLALELSDFEILSTYHDAEALTHLFTFTINGGICDGQPFPW